MYLPLLVGVGCFCKVRLLNLAYKRPAICNAAILLADVTYVAACKGLLLTFRSTINCINFQKFLTLAVLAMDVLFLTSQ